MPESKKLQGLVITLIALLGLAVIAITAVALFGVGESLFGQLAAVIGTMGAAHQTAQAAADRSPNYNPPPSSTPSSSLLPPPVH